MNTNKIMRMRCTGEGEFDEGLTYWYSLRKVKSEEERNN